MATSGPTTCKAAREFRLRIVHCQSNPQYHASVIMRQSVHSPCLIKKLARSSPANICFIALGFLGNGLACMIQ
jgi:hypothetical protein